MFQVIGKRKSFDVLLQARRDLAFIPPEEVAFELWFQGRVETLHLAQFLIALLCRLGEQLAIIQRCAAFQNQSVKQEDGFLGQISYVTACLWDDCQRNEEKERVAGLL